MSRRRFIAMALASLTAACGGKAKPRAQWTVVISTDAPIPQFGNRLIIDVMDKDGKLVCSDCQRQFPAAVPDRWPISFGIVGYPPRLRIRARLFRVSLIGVDGTPAGPALIDRTVTLPPTDSDLKVSLPLPMSCFGVPGDVAAGKTCDPATGRQGPEPEAKPVDTGQVLHVGTWGPAQTTPCTGATPPDMVCVPGGAFLLGDPTVVVGGSTVPEHIVVLSPFRIDRDEFTVQQYLDLEKTHPGLAQPLPSGAPIDHGTFCTYNGKNASLPLNCVSRALAASICAAENKRLPTEAQWEYVAGNRDRETEFPWGSDDNACNYAVVARGDIDQPSLCRATAHGLLPAGPVAGGSPLDITDLGVKNLGGNVAEWVADDFASYADPCWNKGTAPFHDPVCSNGAGLGVVRGGSWAQVAAIARVASRTSAVPTASSPLVGFRCAK